MPYSEVWDNFIVNMQRSGLLKDSKKDDKQTADKLYNVHNHTGADTINEAHPGGATVAESDRKDGGLVETQLEQHEKFVEVCTKTPTGQIIANIVSDLIKAANKCEDSGDLESSSAIDQTIKEILDDPTCKQSMDISVEAPPAAIAAIADCGACPSSPAPMPTYEERYDFHWSKAMSKSDDNAYNVRCSVNENGKDINNDKSFKSEEEALEYYNTLNPMSILEEAKYEESDKLEESKETEEPANDAGPEVEEGDSDEKDKQPSEDK